MSTLLHTHAFSDKNRECSVALDVILLIFLVVHYYHRSLSESVCVCVLYQS